MSDSVRSRARAGRLVALLGVAIIAVGAACTPVVPPTPAVPPVVIYNSNPSTLPGNVTSQGFQCCAVTEFGDQITFAGTERKLTSATVTMSAWALKATYPSLTDATGWDHPLTLNIRRVGPNGLDGFPTPGTVLGVRTQLFHIPWRPVADPTCDTPTAWRDPVSTNCYSGKAFQVTFNLTSLNITSPDSIIWTMAYNTNTRGPDPLGVPGPYDSLNVGAQGTGASIGTDVEQNAAWVSGTADGAYCAPGGTLGSLRRDAGCWSGYTPEISFKATAA